MSWRFLDIIVHISSASIDAPVAYIMTKLKYLSGYSVVVTLRASWWLGVDNHVGVF